MVLHDATVLLMNYASDEMPSDEWRPRHETLPGAAQIAFRAEVLSTVFRVIGRLSGPNGRRIRRTHTCSPARLSRC